MLPSAAIAKRGRRGDSGSGSRHTRLAWRLCNASRSRASASPTDGQAGGRRFSSCTELSVTVASGGTRSTPSPKSSTRWPGTRRAAAARRIPRRRSDWRATAIALTAFIDALGLDRPHVAGLSFGAGLALELYRRQPRLPRSLLLASAYAGWAGSLPADEVEARVQQVLRQSDLPPDQVVRRVAADSVHQLGVGRCCRGDRRDHARLSSSRSARHGSSLRGSGLA